MVVRCLGSGQCLAYAGVPGKLQRSYQLRPPSDQWALQADRRTARRYGHRPSGRGKNQTGAPKSSCLV